MNLSVVIPVYNEEKDIRAAIQDVVDFLPDAEIVVVNDASTDRTLDILHSMSLPNLRIITNEKNMGHGYTVMTGLRAATGDNILYIDADRQIDLSNFKRIPSENLDIFDVISGWRTTRQDKLFRKITSFGLKMTILFRYGYYIKDSNCPFKIYNREALEEILPKVPKTNVIPIACLEVLARKEGMLVAIINTPHKPYDGVRDGFLQIPNKKFFKFVWSAFKEIVRL